MNQASTSNFYFGVNDADGSKLYIGPGYGPYQGLTPSLTVLLGDQNFNIGIKNTSPNYDLDVTGDVNTSKVFRKNSGAFSRYEHLCRGWDGHGRIGKRRVS